MWPYCQIIYVEEKEIVFNLAEIIFKTTVIKIKPPFFQYLQHAGQKPLESRVVVVVVVIIIIIII